LILWLASLLATRAAVDSPDDIVWLSLAHRVPLATAAATIIVTLPVVVIIAAWEATELLFFLVSPSLHHVMKFHHLVWTISSEVTAKRLRGDAVVEVVDDILIGDDSDGGSCVEEVLHV
jgi:hypothetical protein